MSSSGEIKTTMCDQKHITTFVLLPSDMNLSMCPVSRAVRGGTMNPCLIKFIQTQMIERKHVSYPVVSFLKLLFPSRLCSVNTFCLFGRTPRHNIKSGGVYLGGNRTMKGKPFSSRASSSIGAAVCGLSRYVAKQPLSARCATKQQT